MNQLNRKLITSCKNGDLQQIIELFKEGACPNYTNQYDNSCLHLAAKYGHLDIVQYLIEKVKIDKDCRNSFKNTPLHYAAWNGYLGIVKYLVEVANVNIHARNIRKKTPLDYADSSDNQHVVIYLKQHGAE